MKYESVVNALAKYHNARVDVVSDEEFADSPGEVWRWVRLKSEFGFMPYVGLAEADNGIVFDGSAATGSMEDACLAFLEEYVSPTGRLKFHCGYDCSHGERIDAGSVSGLILAMTAMGLLPEDDR